MWWPVIAARVSRTSSTGRQMPTDGTRGPKSHPQEKVALRRRVASGSSVGSPPSEASPVSPRIAEKTRSEPLVHRDRRCRRRQPLKGWPEPQQKLVVRGEATRDVVLGGPEHVLVVTEVFPVRATRPRRCRGRGRRAGPARRWRAGPGRRTHRGTTSRALRSSGQIPRCDRSRGARCVPRRGGTRARHRARRPRSSPPGARRPVRFRWSSPRTVNPVRTRRWAAVSVIRVPSGLLVPAPYPAAADVGNEGPMGRPIVRARGGGDAVRDNLSQQADEFNAC